MKINIPTKMWLDKSTKCYVIYSRKYYISAYGNSIRKAEKMFQFQVDEILKYSKPKGYAPKIK